MPWGEIGRVGRGAAAECMGRNRPGPSAEPPAEPSVIDTPCPLHSRMCRLVSVSNVTATHSYIAPASSAFTAHSGATLIKGNRRTAAPASGAAWPGRLVLPRPVSKYPGSVWRSVPALWLGWNSYNQSSTGIHRDQVLRSRWCVFDDGFNLKTERRHSTRGRVRWIRAADRFFSGQIDIVDLSSI